MAYITAIDTSTLSNQNISSVLLVMTYTNSVRVRKLWLAVELDQIVGVGDYVVYATIQRGGSGSAYRVSGEAITASGGVTALMFPSFAVILNVDDVLKIYAVGQAGDTTTPDVVTRVWEELAGDVNAEGIRDAVGLSSANLDTQLAGIQADTNDIQDRLPGQLQDGLMPSYIEDIANNAITAAALAADVGTEIADAVRTELAVELARIDEDVSAGAHPGDAMTLADDAITAAKFDQSTAHPLAQADAGSTAVARTGADGYTLKVLSDEIAGIEAGSGSGTGTYTDTVTDGVDPLDNVLVQLSTDAAGANMAYNTHTAADGTFTMHPDPGTYYVWFELAGYSFTQGAQVVVT